MGGLKLLSTKNNCELKCEEVVGKQWYSRGDMVKKGNVPMDGIHCTVQ